MGETINYCRMQNILFCKSYALMLRSSSQLVTFLIAIVAFSLHFISVECNNRKMLLQSSSSNEFYGQCKNGQFNWMKLLFVWVYMTCLIKKICILRAHTHTHFLSGDNGHFSNSNPTQPSPFDWNATPECGDTTKFNLIVLQLAAVWYAMGWRWQIICNVCKFMCHCIVFCPHNATQ